jgi:hypothetical protein
LDGKLARFLTLEDAIDIGRRAPIFIGDVISVGQQATEFRTIVLSTTGRSWNPS